MQTSKYGKIITDLDLSAATPDMFKKADPLTLGLGAVALDENVKKILYHSINITLGEEC